METLPHPPPLKPSNSSPPGAGLGAGNHHVGGRFDGASESRLAPERLGMSGKDLSAPSLQSPGIKVELHDGDQGAATAGAATAAAATAAANEDGRPPLAPHPR